MTARVQRAIRCMSAGLMFSTRDTFASSKNSNARRETVFSTITTSGFSATILATAIFKCSLSWRVREESGNQIGFEGIPVAATNRTWRIEQFAEIWMLRH